MRGLRQMPSALPAGYRHSRTAEKGGTRRLPAAAPRHCLSGAEVHVPEDEESVKNIEKKAHGFLSLSKNPKLAANARKQRFAGLRGKCCGTRVRGSVPQPQSSSLALPCQILVSVDGCQSLAAFGSCIHWMRAPSRRPITPAGTEGEWVPGGHNRHRRLATRRRDTKRAGTTAVVPATIEWQQRLLHLHFFDTLRKPMVFCERKPWAFSNRL